MKGYDVNFKLEGCVQEFSRRVILPEKLTFKELEKIITTVFSFQGKHYSEFVLNQSSDEIEGDSPILIDKFIMQKIHYEFNWTSKFINYDWLDGFAIGEEICDDDWKVEITLNQIIDYEKNYATLKTFKGDAIPPANVGGMRVFNHMLFMNHDLAKINPDSIQENLLKIKSVKYDAYDTIIKCEKNKKIHSREILIPEKTTFHELEKIIIVAFDAGAVSFEAKKGDHIDGYLKRNPMIFSKDNTFSIELKKTIYSKRNYPILKDYTGGSNPFTLWHEYYPDESLIADESQSNLDDYF